MRGSLGYKELMLVYRSRGRVHDDGGGKGAGSRNKKLRDNIFNYNPESESELEVGLGDKLSEHIPQELLPRVRLYFLRVPQLSQTLSTIRHQMLKYVNS